MAFDAVKVKMLPTFFLLLLLNLGLVITTVHKSGSPSRKTTGDIKHFQHQDFEFVQSIFARIANFEPPKDHNPADTLALLSTFDMDATLSPYWSKIMMTFGDYPRVPADIQPSRGCGAYQDNLLNSKNAYLIYDARAPRPDNWDFQGSCYMILCPQGELFNFRLDLAGTENPPAWARDAQGNPKTGWGCSGLGDRDTGYMRTIGSTVLHELLHCPDIFEGVPNYDTVIYDRQHYGWKFNIIRKIIDYPPNDRSYGPWKSANLNRQPADPTTGHSISIQNVDNYVWYATSKYWSWKCGRSFGPATSHADNNLHIGRGWVPAPQQPGRPQRGGNPPVAAQVDIDRRSPPGDLSAIAELLLDTGFEWE
ncbi:hypothetical protein G647_10168 [Cladophialophora carrionii CBS 160.54]|uniref:Lysine-specific metallo-endopeptidase domain-containing protein n=1 Tax=Cladophialophora carrionii CBS 160.54 TaxID=1279043 RepID=V9DK78_9EURO|nr:uncharacterized protein G647_10168 [Cladophialophora carrionii CBS 160.54]ETI26723.1 hypothetical protein G647_10168 [Cladophialophora carrionii CBS 160.54]